MSKLAISILAVVSIGTSAAYSDSLILAWTCGMFSAMLIHELMDLYMDRKFPSRKARRS